MYNKGWHNNKKFKMCKKHKKKIHLRQICGFHLNLCMPPIPLPPPRPLITMYAKIDVYPPIEWILGVVAFRQGFNQKSLPFL